MKPARKIFALLFATALLLALVACGGQSSGGVEKETATETIPETEPAPTPEPTPEPTPDPTPTPEPTAEGTWILSSTENENIQTGTSQIVLDEEHLGYYQFASASDLPSFVLYGHLSWEDSAMTLDDEECDYSWEGDTLTLSWHEASFVFMRAGEAEERNTLQPGHYSMVRGYVNGEERHLIEYTLTVDADGTGTAESEKGTVNFVWDKYFIVYDSENLGSFFYTFDGTTLSEYQTNFQRDYVYDN